MQIQGYSGAINLDVPKISLKDITHGLSQICRYVGACDVFWSVGQHTLLCNTLMNVLPVAKEFRLAVLLHDAPEYIIGDQNGVWKSILGDKYAALEKLVETAVAKKFGFEPVLFNSTAVKLIDRAALYVESKALFTSRVPELWLDLDEQFSNAPKLTPYIAALTAARNNFPTMSEIENELREAILLEIAE